METTLLDTHAAPIVGQLVTSLAGRDKNTVFAVVKIEGEFVYLADGRQRKTETPKKKNARHIKKTKASVDTALIDCNKLLYKAICNTQINEKG